MKYLVSLFLFLILSLLTLTLFVGVEKTQEKPKLSLSKPHLYKDKKTSLEEINITVFYFIPKDSISSKNEMWKEVAEKKLKELQEFHNIQFENKSKITYDFFDKEIIGESFKKEYETFFGGEDQDALLPIKKEITRRVLTEEGDLYVKKERSDSIRQVYFVIFEGKGAAGNDTFALLGREYLTEKIYSDTGTTFLAHEFYHTLGILDNYKTAEYVFNDGKQIPVSIITSKDIMGQVNIPLVNTYIDRETLRNMGI